MWRDIVACRPHDWFGADTAPLLEALCEAVIVHRAISHQVTAFDPATLGDSKAVAAYDALTRMQERQARVMASLATKLRLTNQSRYTPHVANTAAKKVRGARPWEA